MSIVLSTDQASGGLPLEVTSFVGRRHDRVRVRKLVETSRLVTLTGFGGMGKTRLALRVAHDLRRHFANGVYWVPLGDSTAHVPDQMAIALGLEGRATDPSSWVAEFLRNRASLLVLDNCEHVVDAAADMADRLLHTCPAVRLLATSREPLRIGGEAVFSLEPLTAPESSQEGIPLHSFESVQLFVERARSVLPDFELTDANRDSVAAVCRKLQGIPLALELAAARLRTLSPTELDNELSEQWEVLGRGGRTAPQRQMTISACIDWSFGLCSPAEQIMWAETAVFVDGFELEAAVAVSSSPGGRSEVRDLLASLVDKSLLSVIRHDAVSRYSMLPPLRQRGLSELKGLGREGVARRRHRDYYVSLLAQAHQEWFGDRQLDWLMRLRGDLGNLHCALDFCVTEPGEADVGLRAMPHLLGLTALGGLMRQGRQWGDLLLDHASGDPETRALALRTLWWCAAAQGDVAAAAQYLERAHALAGQVGVRTRLLLTQAAGINAQYQGHLDVAERLLSEAAEGLEALGELEELAVTYVMLTVNGTFRGDAEAAWACHRRSKELIPQGALWHWSWALWAAALALRLRGDVKGAEALLKESLKNKRTIFERLGIALTLEELASLAVDDRPESAVVLMAAAEREWDSLGAMTQALPGMDTRHRAAETKARSLLGEELFAESWKRGRSLDLEAAIVVALGEQPAVLRGSSRASDSHALLTRRESQIAAMIHEGLTNKGIAKALVISPRTVESHVENILTKLGFTSRAQVVRWVAEQQTKG